MCNYVELDKLNITKLNQSSVKLHTRFQLNKSESYQQILAHISLDDQVIITVIQNRAR